MTQRVVNYTYGTGNPVLPDGSVDVRDGIDNLQSLDIFMNADEDTYNQRDGDIVKTRAGAVRSVGVQRVGDFTTGCAVTERNQGVLYEPDGTVYVWLGALPKVVPAASSPATTGGIGPTGWLDIGDASLRAELAGTGGSSLIGRGTSDVDSDLTAIENQSASLEDVILSVSELASVAYSAPSIPAITSKNKAIFKPTSVTDCLTWIVSRKAQGKAGWVAVAISNEVAPSDAQNYGGASNYRPAYVINGASFFVGKTSMYNKTAGTVISALTAAQINTIWGYVPNGAEYYAQSVGASVNWNARQCYDCAGIGDSITYNVSKGDCTVRFGMTNASSTSVKVQISFDGANFVDYQTLSLRHPPSGSIFKRDVRVTVGATGPYFVRVENAAAGSCFVAGINIGQLPEFGEIDIDNAMFVQALSVGGVPNQYQGGLGANEFAAKELSTGKFFGTYHGGHGGFLQRLRTESASYNIDTTTPPALVVVSSLQLHSASTLTVGATLYSYACETFFGDGANVSTYSLKLGSGSPVVCERVYTHMCTTQRDFDWVHLPLTINKTDDGDVNVGDCQFIQQFRGYDAAQLNCYFSGVNVRENANGGAYVSFQTNYNKQYYGPALGSSSFALTGGQFVTAKEYM